MPKNLAVAEMKDRKEHQGQKDLRERQDPNANQELIVQSESLA
jgi:hypothetical protein